MRDQMNRSEDLTSGNVPKSSLDSGEDSDYPYTPF